MRKCRVDANQNEIVKGLRKHGAIVKHVHTIKNLFDILVFYNNKTYCMEIKNGLKSKLTEGEKQCKDDIESVGVKYHVIYNLEQALKLIKIN